MILKILGLSDILAAVVLIFWGLDINLVSISWIFVIYLFLRSIIFIKSPASLIDVLIGIMFIFIINGHINTILLILSILWLLQKGLFSLVDL
tara:strand:+ start:85695 stop:85970 length:276 start_codon:yes stop_codon:yes gene_type:complete